MKAPTNVIAALLGVAICLVVWWVASRQFSSIVVPSPGDTGKEIARLLSSPEFWSDVLFPTLFRTLVGGAIAAVVGIFLGLTAGSYQFFNAMVEPGRFVLSAIPAPVFVILALLWVGADHATIVLTVAVLLTPLFFVAARDGMRGVDVSLLEMAKVFRVQRGKVIKSIVVPAVLISLVPASRVAIANALRLTILAEILVSVGGIGERINLARQYLNSEELFALIIILVALIVVLERLLTVSVATQRRGI